MTDIEAELETNCTSQRFLHNELIASSFIFYSTLQEKEWLEIIKFEVRNSRVRMSSCKTELRKMASHFELLSQIFVEILFSSH